jgi:hypothetical protein
MTNANKGEWSELYVFLKLLADKKLYAADSNLNKIESIYYPILKIFRENYEYHTNSFIKVIDSSGRILLEVPVQEFKENALLLLEKIRTSTGRSFEVEEIRDFLQKIKISKIKAKSNEKRDITVVVHDIFTGFNPILGFSIKSRLGGSSTLLNASGHTNFVYNIVCPQNVFLAEEEIDYINSINSKSKIRDRVSYIFDKGCDLRFQRIDSQQFFNNLMIIDSALPLMLSEMLKYFYSGIATTVKDLTALLTRKNPLNFDLSQGQPFYEYKIKNFLTDIALGMTPSAPWGGIYDATGGYIVVKEDGEVLCYHIYNRNEFQDYLLNNTKLETPSSGRHRFGFIYPENGAAHMKLNLQIRFI